MFEKTVAREKSLFYLLLISVVVPTHFWQIYLKKNIKD